MRSRAAIPVDSKRALVALAASNTLGVLTLYVIPITVGAITDGFATSEGTAGIVSSWELGAMAAVSMLLAARYELLDLRRLTWIGSITYVTGNLLSLWSMTEGQWQIFLAARGVVGVGNGILFAISSGLAAQTAKPAKRSRGSQAPKSQSPCCVTGRCRSRWSGSGQEVLSSHLRVWGCS
jgi:predicted MFS family arabinose efflux permease